MLIEAWDECTKTDAQTFRASTARAEMAVLVRAEFLRKPLTHRVLSAFLPRESGTKTLVKVATGCQIEGFFYDDRFHTGDFATLRSVAHGVEALLVRWPIPSPNEPSARRRSFSVVR